MGRYDWTSFFEEIDGEAPLGRLLRYGESRYWLLTALEASAGAGMVVSLGDDTESWEFICQEWRIQLETHARLLGGRDAVTAGNDFFRATLVAAFAIALRRLSRPSLQYVELWCTGEVRRIELLEANENHGPHCACQVLNDTLFELEEVVHGLDPWVKWAVPGEPKVWAFLHGLRGPHIVRLVYGVPTSLEDVAGFDRMPDPPFTWGMPGGSTYLAAAALLEDLTGDRPEPEMWERFGDTVLCAFEPGQQFVLTASDVLEWMKTPTSRRGWPARWARRSD